MRNLLPTLCTALLSTCARDRSEALIAALADPHRRVFAAVDLGSSEFDKGRAGTVAQVSSPAPATPR